MGIVGSRQSAVGNTHQNFIVRASGSRIYQLSNWAVDNVCRNSIMRASNQINISFIVIADESFSMSRVNA